MKERIYKGCKREVPAKKFNNLKEILANCKEEFGDKDTAETDVVDIVINYRCNLHYPTCVT